MITLTRLVAMAAFVTITGCNALSDPAVRIAFALEKGTGQLLQSQARELEVRCDTGLSGRYVAILHPAGTLADAELVQAGIPRESLAELRSLRLGPHEAVYVIPLDHQDLPSRTTWQANVLGIPALLARVSAEPTIVIVIRKVQRGVVAVGIR